MRFGTAARVEGSVASCSSLRVDADRWRPGTGGSGKGRPGGDAWGVGLPSRFARMWLDVTSLPLFLLSARKSRFLLTAPGQPPGKARGFGRLS